MFAAINHFTDVRDGDSGGAGRFMLSPVQAQGDKIVKNDGSPVRYGWGMKITVFSQSCARPGIEDGEEGNGDRDFLKAMFDIAIIGAGVVGASVARLLSSYNISTVLVERRADVSFGVTKANSGIIHAGFHHGPDPLKARLEVRGNAMFDRLQAELDSPSAASAFWWRRFPMRRCRPSRRCMPAGSPTASRIEVINRDRILALEPKLHPDVVGGLWAPTGGVIEPYRFVFALVENAATNGVKLFTDWSLSAARRTGDRWLLSSETGQTLEARRVVNAAGLFADEIARMAGAGTSASSPQGRGIPARQSGPGAGHEPLSSRPRRRNPRASWSSPPRRHADGRPDGQFRRRQERPYDLGRRQRRVFSSAAASSPGISERDCIA